MKRYKVYILLILCTLFWSGNFIIAKYLNQKVGPIELSFFRWFFVFLFILPSLFFVNLKKIFSIIKKNFLIMSTLSVLGITLYNTIVYTALQSANVTNALLINSSTPMLIILFSYLFFKQKISYLQIIGVIISTLGVVFLVLKGDFTNILNLQSNSGDLLIVIASICWSFYTILIKYRPKELSFYEFFVSIVLLGFIFLLPIYLYQGYEISYEIQQIKDYWYFFLYISFFTSILSYFLWNIGTETIGPSKTGQFTHLMPVFGAFLAYFILNENLHFYHLLGASLIASGILLALLNKRTN